MMTRTILLLLISLFILQAKLFRPREGPHGPEPRPFGNETSNNGTWNESHHGDNFTGLNNDSDSHDHGHHHNSSQNDYDNNGTLPPQHEVSHHPHGPPHGHHHNNSHNQTHNHSGNNSHNQTHNESDNNGTLPPQHELSHHPHGHHHNNSHNQTHNHSGNNGTHSPHGHGKKVFLRQRNFKTNFEGNRRIDLNDILSKLPKDFDWSHLPNNLPKFLQDFLPHGETNDENNEQEGHDGNDGQEGRDGNDGQEGHDGNDESQE